jgi:uncharacterized membrane protein YccC
MATSPQKGDDHQLPPKKSTVLLLLTIADTTWRLFIPIIGLTVAGLLLDKQFGTKPWLMIISILVGVGIAVLLVRMQLKKVVQV